MRESRVIRSFRDLEAYQAAFDLQQQIFERSKVWPKEEIYSLTSQIRRSSRSVGASLAEAWGKRRYPAHFLSKLTDADSENLETQHWIDTAAASGYIRVEEQQGWLAASEEIGRRLGGMIAKHETFCIREDQTTYGSALSTPPPPTAHRPLTSDL